MRRPASVTVVAVLLIVGAVLGLGGALVGVLRPTNAAATAAAMHGVSRVPLGVATLVGAVAGVLDFVSAVLLLRGRVAGRTIYVVVGALMLVWSVATSRAMALPFAAVSVAVYALFVFFLFRPAATRWLRSGVA